MPGFAHFLNERDAPPVAQQSIVELHSWRLLLTQSGVLRLSIALSPGTLRITSPLAAIDFTSVISRTWSGRLYRFACPPEQDELIRSLLVANAARSGFATAIDVSDQAWLELSMAAKRPGVFQAERIKCERIAPDSKVNHSEH